MDSFLPVIKLVPFFSELSEEEHTQIIKNVIMNYYPVGHVFFKEGDEAGNMYIIKKGMVKISKKTGDNEKELAMLSDNNFFGEMGLVSDLPRNASATAMSECEIFELNKNEFIKLMENLPELANKVSHVYIDRDKANSVSNNQI